MIRVYNNKLIYFMMKKEKWNPEDWQGRSERQVKENNTIMLYALIGLGVAIIVTMIMQA